MNCMTCKHFNHIKLQIGECRRYPPQYTAGAASDSFPKVIITEWCGEFKKPTAKRTQS